MILHPVEEWCVITFLTCLTFMMIKWVKKNPHLKTRYLAVESFDLASKNQQWP